MKKLIAIFLAAIIAATTAIAVSAGDYEEAAKIAILYIEEGKDVQAIENLLLEQGFTKDEIYKAYEMLVDWGMIDASDLKTSSYGSAAAKTGGKISKFTIMVSNAVYTGKSLKPDVTITDGSYKLVKGTDYTLSYKNNKSIGKATITVKGKGDYSGSKKVTFKIVPKTPVLSAATSGKKITLSWAKITGAANYEITYSENGGKFKKLATVKSSKKSYSTSKLDFEKNSYMFRIRAYKKVSKTTYYSDYGTASLKKTEGFYGTYQMGSFKLLYMGEDSIFMIDGDSGFNYRIDGGAEWTDKNTLKLIIDMMTEEYEYYAEYYLEFSGDTLTFTHLYDRVDLVKIGDSGVYTKTAEDPAIVKENEY